MFESEKEKGKKFVKRILKWIETEFKLIGNTLLNIMIEEIFVAQALEWAFTHVKKLKRLSDDAKAAIKFAVGSLVGEIFSSMLMGPDLFQSLTGVTLSGLGEAFSKINHLEDEIRIFIKGVMRFLHDSAYTTLKLTRSPQV